MQRVRRAIQVSILIRPEGGCNVHSALPSISFNPHPARRPDATCLSISRRISSRFNPHPARRPDNSCDFPSLHPTCFQSSSGQKAGCNHHAWPDPNRFNPHPARRPDATVWLWHRRRFNPHPARRPDATGRPSPTFQSSSGQKAGCNLNSAYATSGFNPHPARRPDATIRRVFLSCLPSCFNPHPARRPDATTSALDGARSTVSILIRPEGRMQPGATCFPEKPATS